MSIKEPMMQMIQNKFPDKTREELVNDLFKLSNIKKGDNCSNKNRASHELKTNKK